MLDIVDETEEQSQKDQVVTASKPSKPLLTPGFKEDTFVGFETNTISLVLWI